MKIGIEATSAAESQKVGVGYYLYNLIRAIALLHHHEHRYTLYLRRPWSAPSNWIKTGSVTLGESQKENPPRLVSKILKFPYLWAQVRLPIELWNCPQDVYFFPAPVIPLLYQPAKSVVTIHDVAFLFFPECFSPMLRQWLNIATKRGISGAKKIIAVSEATRQDLIAYYGVSPEKIVVIHHGVHERYRPLNAELSEMQVGSIFSKYHIDTPYILCIGTLQKRKNIPRLLQAFYLLKQKHNIPHKLVLVGQKCPDLPEHEIFSTIGRLSLHENVIWTGYVAEQDMFVLLNGAELFVFPSLYEGFGMPLLEAMACGIPVVCSNTSSMPEVTGESAVLFDPYNVESITTALYHALMDQELRIALRQKGLQRAQEFTWETCAQKTIEVLEEAGSP